MYKGIASLLTVTVLGLALVPSAQADRGRNNEWKPARNGPLITERHYDNHHYGNNNQNYDWDRRPTQWNRPTQPSGPSWNSNRPYRSPYIPYDQQQFIQGVKNGRLSEREIRELKVAQANLQEERRRYAQDGYLSQREREDLRKDSKEYLEKLEHELNDGERRNYW